MKMIIKNSLTEFTFDFRHFQVFKIFSKKFCFNLKNLLDYQINRDELRGIKKLKNLLASFFDFLKF